MLTDQPAKKRRRLFLGAFISLVALAIAFWGIQPSRFIATLQHANYAYMIPAAVLLFLGLLTRSQGWRVMLGGKVSYRRAFFALNEGYLLSNILPFRLGDLARGYLVSVDGGVGAAEAMGTVVLERMVDVMINLAALLVTLPFLVSPVWANEVAWGGGLALLAAIGFLYFIVQAEEELKEWLRSLPGEGLWGLSDIIARFVAGLRELLESPERLLKGSFWIFLSWIVGWLTFWFYIEMFGHQALAVVILFTVSIVGFGVALPSSPAALGVYEAAMVAGLTYFGYSKELALSVAILSHGVQFATTGILGAWGLFSEGRSLEELAEKAQSLFRRQGGESNP